MKNYLARFTIKDNQHEHSGFLTIEAKNLDEAYKLAKKEEHNREFPADENNKTYFDYGDAETSSHLDGVEEITKTESQRLEELIVAFPLE